MNSVDATTLGAHRQYDFDHRGRGKELAKALEDARELYGIVAGCEGLKGFDPIKIIAETLLLQRDQERAAFRESLQKDAASHIEAAVKYLESQLGAKLAEVRETAKLIAKRGG